MSENMTEAERMCAAILRDVKEWHKAGIAVEAAKRELHLAESNDRRCEKQLAGLIIPKDFKGKGRFTFRYGDGHLVAEQCENGERRVMWLIQPSPDQQKELAQ